MAGVKGRSGGYRPGAGRKSAASYAQMASDRYSGDDAPKVEIETTDPLLFLERMMNDPCVDEKLRIESAKAILPYKHQKLEDAGKKAQKEEAAQRASEGKFAAAALPPMLRAVN